MTREELNRAFDELMSLKPPTVSLKFKNGNTREYNPRYYTQEIHLNEDLCVFKSCYCTDCTRILRSIKLPDIDDDILWE